MEPEDQQDTIAPMGSGWDTQDVGTSPAYRERDSQEERYLIEECIREVEDLYPQGSDVSNEDIERVALRLGRDAQEVNNIIQALLELLDQESEDTITLNPIYESQIEE